MLSYVSGWLFAGAVIGILFHRWLAVTHRAGLGATLLLGIVGALVGGFLSWVLFAPASGVVRYDLGLALPGWGLAILGAIAVLGGYILSSRKSYR